MDFSTILNIASLAVAVFSLLAAILVFAVESRRTRKATEEQTKMENIRASLSDFQGVRREHPVRMLKIAPYEEQKEHTAEESLDYAAWLNTYTKVREMLGKQQKRWTL